MRKTYYDQEGAVSYAHKWAYRHSPQYYNFDRLEDCTNFTSQVLYAASEVMNPKPTFGRYYHSLNNRAPACTGVEFLYKFLAKNLGIGRVLVDADFSQVEPGGLVYLSFDGIAFSHSPTIVSAGAAPSPSSTLVAAHTLDTDNGPLNTYQCVSITYVNTC
ncbi:MAG: amidase [Clostridia bacterium]|nr:amidase [Clostridia bacterium]